jgi:hypothetical protein
MEENLIFRISFKPSFKHIKNHQFRRPVQGDMAKTLSVAQSEISLGQIASLE